MMRHAFKLFLFASALLLSTCANAVEVPSASTTLNTVKHAGTLACGVVREDEDYSKADAHGNRAALDRDICKAIAAAVIGEHAKVAIVPYPDEPAAIRALHAGKVELVATATPSFTNRTSFQIGFSPVIFFDAQGFLVTKSSGIASAQELAAKKVCFIDETASAVNLALYASRENVKLLPFPFEEQGEMDAAMYTANCAAITGDLTQLANIRANFGPRANEFELLPQLIAKDPLAVAYRAADPQWASIVDWTVGALIQAEESGLTAASIDRRRNDQTDPAIQFYFGSGSRMGQDIGLDADWATRAVRAVGNYGEIYERDLGNGSPLRIPRGVNGLWNRGGLLYAPVVAAR